VKNAAPIVVALLVLVLAGVFVAPLVLGPEASNDGVDEPAATPAITQPRSSSRRAVVDPDAASPGATVVDGTAPWVRANNAGVAALEAGDLDGAVDAFEEALDLVEDEADATITDDDRSLVRGNATEAFARRARARWDAGAHDDAIDELDRGVELSPEREDLAGLLERWRREREVEREFASYGSLRFELSYDGDVDDIVAGGAQRAVELLEAAYGELWLFLGHDPVTVGGERIEVVFYTPEDFRDVTGLGHWAGGAYDGRIRVPIEDFDGDEARWTATLWHELCHAFLHDMIDGGPPGWLDEGLAQWLEPGRTRDLERARAGLSSDALVSLEDLSGSLAQLGDPATIRRGYATALAFVDHLVVNYGDYVLKELLVALANGRTAEARFEELVGFPLTSAWSDLGEQLDRERGR